MREVAVQVGVRTADSCRALQSVCSRRASAGASEPQSRVPDSPAHGPRPTDQGSGPTDLAALLH